MSKLSIQFHALPPEIFRLVDEDFDDVFVTEACGDPLSFRTWRGSTAACSDESLRALAFTLEAPEMKARDLIDFRRINPDALILEVGRLSPLGLGESWLSAMSENVAAMTRWKRAAGKLKRSTMTGAIAVNPISKATATMRAHRFTVGAQLLASRGIAMLPAAGNSIIKLPQIVDPC